MKKYIPVFGDQSLFDDAPEDAVFVRYGKESYIFKESMLGCTIGSLRDAPIVAMRRIEEAPEPKRWTWEDKKAGRLPEVGAKCRQGHKDEIVVAVTEKFVVTECQDMSVCTTRKDVFMRSYNPIETPAEKAQRVEYEFVKYVMKDMTLPFELACIYERGVRAAYRKLSGELAAPKGGE